MLNFFFEGRIGEMLAPVTGAHNKLFLAIQHGRNNELQSLMAEIPDPAKLSEGGVAAIHVACKYNNTYALDMLLNMRIDVNLRDANGNTPLHHAARSGWLNLCKYLVERGGNVLIKNHAGQNSYDVSDAHHLVRQYLLPLQFQAEGNNNDSSSPFPGSGNNSGSNSQDSMDNYGGGHTVVAPPPGPPPAGNSYINSNSNQNSTSVFSRYVDPSTLPISYGGSGAGSGNDLQYNAPQTSYHPQLAHYQPPNASTNQMTNQAPNNMGNNFSNMADMGTVSSSQGSPTKAGVQPPGYFNAPPPAFSNPLTQAPQVVPPPQATQNYPQGQHQAFNSQYSIGQYQHQGYGSTYNKTSSAPSRIIQPDGFHTSASDPVLQRKYGHIKQTINIAPPPLGGMPTNANAGGNVPPPGPPVARPAGAGPPGAGLGFPRPCSNSPPAPAATPPPAPPATPPAAAATPPPAVASPSPGQSIPPPVVAPAKGITPPSHTVAQPTKPAMSSGLGMRAAQPVHASGVGRTSTTTVGVAPLQPPTLRTQTASLALSAASSTNSTPRGLATKLGTAPNLASAASNSNPAHYPPPPHSPSDDEGADVVTFDSNSSAVM